nr:EOG090X0BI6 [Lepidurus arcticus]
MEIVWFCGKNMGKTLIADEKLTEYVNALIAKKEFIVGLLIGQETASKTYVIHITRTPEPVEDSKKEQKKITKKQGLEDVDETLLADHARQVVRMLPGGIHILGIFVVTPEDPFQGTQNVSRLRKTLTAIKTVLESSPFISQTKISPERAVLHICSLTHKLTCKSIDISSPIASARPADFKFQNGGGTPWLELDASLLLDLGFPISKAECQRTLRQQLEDSLSAYSSTLQKALILFDDSLREESSEMLLQTTSKEGKKKNKAAAALEEPLKTVQVHFLVPDIERTTQVKDCVTELRFSGKMCVKAFVHAKATVEDGFLALREDVLRSLWARCEMHCDSLVSDEEQRGISEERSVLHEPPRRVIAPLPYSVVTVSDYLFPGEGPSDSLPSLAELLDLNCNEGDVQDDWESPAELENVSLPDVSVNAPPPEVTSDVCNPTTIIIAGLVGFVATLLSYFMLQNLQSS